ncbi:DUF2079 domain-containing protein [Leptodesmis sichuanensis]|uniref:DUF2079 domain-containing protein n=1 Tax=Leptodesmis sichuanensis TaxID=2906798 RepID=UPI001F2A8923|nr:DUF2079 domain-containing protein [Leptodesmis sichuanensis]UIE39396.1 DUF2079 domain-containing protein [Leptodesmis sichuanensis A121]
MNRFKFSATVASSVEAHRKELKPVLLLASVFFAVTLIFGLHRYLTFYASYDQGIFNQLFWNGIHGQFFQSSLSSVLSGAVVHDGQLPSVSYHRLGQHFDPILLLWHPFYALFPNAAMLVVLQVVQVTAGGLVLYVLARQRLQPGLSGMITASYYGAIAVLGPTFSNFHDLSQIPLLLFTLFLALEKRWWTLFWLMAGLILLVREDTGVVLFSVGIYLILSRRFPRIGIILCGMGFGYVLLATNVLMPLFSRDISQRFMIERFGHFATGNEASTLDILWGILSNPVRLFQQFFDSLDEKVAYMVGQTLPLAFVPLISGSAWALISAPLAQLLLQGGDSRFSIYIRYAITLVPGLFYGAILWWSVHQERFRPRFRQIWIGFIILSLLVTIAKSPHRVFYFAVPDSFKPWVYVSLPRQWEHSGQIRSLLQEIPPEASVSASTYLVPHLSSRREVLRLPFLQLRNDQNQAIAVEYVVADLWQMQQYQPAFKSERGYLLDLLPRIDQLVESKSYGILGLKDGVVLLKRGEPSSPDLLNAWKELKRSYEASLEKGT